MEEQDFRKLIHHIIGLYQLSPEAAAQMLQRIMKILAQNADSDKTPP